MTGVNQSTQASKKIEYWQLKFEKNAKYVFAITSPLQRVSFRTRPR